MFHEFIYQYICFFNSNMNHMLHESAYEFRGTKIPDDLVP